MKQEIEEIAKKLKLNVVTVNPQDYMILSIWEGHYEYITFEKKGKLYVYRVADGYTLEIGTKEEVSYRNLGVIEFCGHKIWTSTDYLFNAGEVQKKISAYAEKAKYNVYFNYTRDRVRATNIATGETHIIEFE